MMNSADAPFTLYSLNNMVRNILGETLSARYWVTGELSEVRETSAGHCYIELVQRDEAANELVAKARGTVWARIYSLLKPYFLEQTGQPFSAGLKVLLQVKVGFHELYGYTLEVCDIEPAYTVGDLARQRQAVIRRLADEGVINLNKELAFPLLPQRIAVISSSTAAGYGDFCDQLARNRYGFVFYPHLFPSPMQGSGVEQGIISALDRIAANIDMWDVVVIIRGGGATSELSCFDTYDLANNCAQFPLPIITGIGHQRDESVLDVVAHTRAKTPTAAAELLIHSMLEQDACLSGIRLEMTAAVQRKVEWERQRLHSLHHRLPLSAAVFMKDEAVRVKMISQNLVANVRNLLQKELYRLELSQKSIEAASPERILAMGYSLTRVNGKLLRSVEEVSAGDEVVNLVADGEIRSVVKEKEKKN